MNNKDKLLLGIDIGGTKIALCLADATGKIIDAQRVQSGTKDDYSVALQEICDCGDSMIAANGGRKKIAAIGIGAPGPMNVKAGILEKSPNMLWEDVPVRDDLHKHFNLPVALDNDANGGVLAEWFFGLRLWSTRLLRSVLRRREHDPAIARRARRTAGSSDHDHAGSQRRL